MKNVARFLVSIAALAACPVAALANQLVSNLYSSATTTSYVGYNTNSLDANAPAGKTAQNGAPSSTAAPYGAWTTPSSSATYTQPYTAPTSGNTWVDGSYWAAPVGVSTWVAYEQNAYPTASVSPYGDAGVGAFEYESDAFAYTAGQTLQLSVLADNTTAIWLVNGNNQAYQIQAYPSGYPATIDGSTPDYSTVDYIILQSSELTATGNVIYFDVSNTNNAGNNPPGSPTGLDYELDSLSPEPSSFLLLATGMLGVAGVAGRRVRA
jgi:hypothetical protein